MLMYGSQLVAHAETFEELGENDKALNEKLVAHAKELEELKEKNEKLEEKKKASFEKLVAHAKELEELKEKNEKLEDNIEEKKKLIEEKKKLIEEKEKLIEEKKKALNENEALVEFLGELRTNIMKHLKFSREMSKRELEVKLEEMMQNITNDLDKRIARVSKASIKRDNEIELAIVAAPTGAAKEEEWIEQL